jgi:hypothetical protein
MVMKVLRVENSPDAIAGEQGQKRGDVSVRGTLLVFDQEDLLYFGNLRMGLARQEVYRPYLLSEELRIRCITHGGLVVLIEDLVFTVIRERGATRTRRGGSPLGPTRRITFGRRVRMGRCELSGDW